MTGFVWALGALLLPVIAAAQETEPKLGDKETRIEAALAEPAELNFVDTPLGDVVDFLRQKHEIQIQLDNKGLTDAGVGSDTPITRMIHDIKLASALDLTLGELDLTYVIRDEVLVITTKAEAENMLMTRVYPVADLVTPRDDDLVVNSKADFNELIDLVTSTVEPTTWDEVGGPGTIQVHRKSQALVISQTYTVHREISTLLESLRAVDRRQAELRHDANVPVADDETFQLKVYKLPAKWLVAHYPSTKPAVQPAPAAPVPAAQPAPASQPATTPAAKPSEPKPTANPGEAMPQMGGGVSTESFDPSAAEELADAIPMLIEPLTWEDAGGEGMVYALRGSLVVRQTAYVHRQIRRLLRPLE